MIVISAHKTGAEAQAIANLLNCNAYNRKRNVKYITVYKYGHHQVIQTKEPKQ